MNEELNVHYQEICKLEAMLTEAGIPHSIERCFDGWRLVYPQEREKPVCSVIEHRASIGSRNDKLEIMGLLNKVEKKVDMVMGHLTADNVYDRIRRDWERRQAR